MKNFIILAVVILGIGAIGYTLYTNKNELETSANLAMKTSDHIAVTMETVKEETILRSFEANGVFEPSQELKLMAETGGAIVKINKRKGDFVKKGDVILQVDDRLIQSEYTIVKLNRDQAEKDMKRFENLASTDAVTQKQLEEYQKAFKIYDAQFSALQKRLDDTRISAPISGYINQEYFEMGALVSTGMPIVDIINSSPLKLTVKVSESEVSSIKKGDQVSVKANAIASDNLTGKVDFISNKADGSFKYEVILIVSGDKLGEIKPGMFGTATFKSSKEEKILKISRKSIAGSIKDPGVFLVENEQATYRPVKINPLQDGTVEVLQGLKAGEEVISSGLINIKEGTKVKIQ